MDAFSRSLAAAALVDGQHFTLPGFGTIEGVYISARIDHGARRVEAPRLEVRWDSEEDPNAQTFAALLVSTGATTFEAEDIENKWLDALTTGDSIQVGDLGTLLPNKAEGTCTFESNTAALAAAFSGSQTVTLEPISKRALPDSPVAPVVAIDTKSQGSASAKTKDSFVRKLMPMAAAAAIVVLGVVAIQFFSRSSTIDANAGKAVTVNQDRLNRSPREEATTADLPMERIGEISPSEFSTDEVVAYDNSSLIDDSPIGSITEELSAIPDNGPFDHSSAIPSSRDTQVVPSFDPAGLAGLSEDESMFTTSEIDVVIVLGSFSNTNNAARLTEKVAAAGLIPYVDQPGDLTRVGATFSVSSEAEIEEVKLRMQKQFNSTAWVLE
ncbi:MAG: SPOR domain-containing protein [Saprospiraceae bacterium]